MAERRQQGRQDAAEGGLRIGAAKRAVPAVEPARHPCGHLLSVGKRARRDQFADRAIPRIAALARLEQPVECLLGGGNVRLQIGKQCGTIGKTIEMREPFERVASGDLVRLPVLQHLDTVFHHPQPGVSSGELLRRRLFHQSHPRERMQRRARVAAAQFRVATAVDQLVGLSEKFDLANSPPTALQVEPRAKLCLARVGFANSHAQLSDVIDCPEIDAAPPHERPYARQETLAPGNIARCGTRPDEGSTFPRQCGALVMRCRCVDRDSERRDLRCRAQPQVDAEDVAFLCMVGQQAHDIARHALRGFGRGRALARREHVGIE